MGRCAICTCDTRPRLAVSEVAAACDVSEHTVGDWIRSGKLIATKLNPPRGRWLVHHDSLDELVKAGHSLEGQHAG